MLAYLRIRGLALLDDVTLELSPGMNVLTGETGAGKSIIVDALTLLRGGRAKPELVRAGADAAIVDAQFDLGKPAADRVASVLDDHGLPRSDAASIVAQRTLPRSGRARCFVQSQLTTQAALGAVGAELVDICSQHEHHSLTEVARHIELLDGFAGLDEDVAAYEALYRELRGVMSARAELLARAAEGLSRADYLRFQLEELERVAPEPGEHGTLSGRVKLLRDARSWAEFAREAEDTLYESENAVAMRLGSLLERARRGVEHSPRLAAIAEQLESARAASEEAAHLAARFASEMDFEPEELTRAEDRLNELDVLRRKHGADFEDLASRAAAMREELSTLDHAEENLTQLAEREEGLRAAAVERARALGKARRAAAHGLATALETELAALHIPKARLEARIEELPPGELGPRGLDRVEFLFSANPGEPLAALTRVASGGELSRVLLALKGVLRAGDRVTTYVFDEIDAGVGGAVAEAIGRRLRRAAHGHQVLCITHLPQIAAFADAHYRVEKHAQRGRTVTQVSRLSDAERVEELARMLGGARVGETARDHARQLLSEATRGEAATVGAKKKQAPAQAATAKKRR